jgi:hypothetical protein
MNRFILENNIYNVVMVKYNILSSSLTLEIGIVMDKSNNSNKLASRSAGSAPINAQTL